MLAHPEDRALTAYEALTWEEVSRNDLPSNGDLF
jgi:hypothetical protein